MRSSYRVASFSTARALNLFLFGNIGLPWLDGGLSCFNKWSNPCYHEKNRSLSLCTSYFLSYLSILRNRHPRCQFVDIAQQSPSFTTLTTRRVSHAVCVTGNTHIKSSGNSVHARIPKRELQTESHALRHAQLGQMEPCPRSILITKS